jgi:hypothetical protein
VAAAGALAPAAHTRKAGMLELVFGIQPTGEVRAIYDDAVPELGLLDAVPRRASHIEPIQSGPNAGKWFADMSPLGEDFQYCLWPPFVNQTAAKAGERKHIIDNWL